MQQYHQIKVIRCKLEKVMNQVYILEDTRTQVHIRMTRAVRQTQTAACSLPI